MIKNKFFNKQHVFHSIPRKNKKRRFKLVQTHVKRMSNSCPAQIKLVKNATQNYALERDLIINACLTWKYTKELNSFLILYKIR
jgi:hypothetical protein